MKRYEEVGWCIYGQIFFLLVCGNWVLYVLRLVLACKSRDIVPVLMPPRTNQLDTHDWINFTLQTSHLRLIDLTDLGNFVCWVFSSFCAPRFFNFLILIEKRAQREQLSRRCPQFFPPDELLLFKSSTTNRTKMKLI